MRKSVMSAAIAAAVLGFAAMGSQVGEAKINIIIGPWAQPQVYAPRARSCHWETRRGPCYVDTVCVRRKPNGRCKRFKRQQVCERQNVRVCY